MNKPTHRQATVALLALVLLLSVLVVVLNLRDEDEIPDDEPAALALTPTPEQLERGAYLARAGNCVTCHTTRGGADYAGGRAIDTPFGRVYSTNLTPDAATGIGGWSAAHFWRALHNGRSRDGRLLYPAFPYPNYTRVTREDADAIYAYLRSLPAVEQPNRAHELRFPYNLQVSLAVWRALFFSPGVHEAEAGRSAQWNRGAYLVRGLGHCIACHSSRNLFGATSGEVELGGGLIPLQGWYAPSLASPAEAGVADWKTEQVVQLLKTGVSPQGSVMGPMAEVVFRSTQYLNDADLTAMAVFLKELPQAGPHRRRESEPPDPAVRSLGERLYGERCAGCHGKQGEGAAGAYAPLAGNRAVTLPSATNVLRVVLNGGFPPATAGNPRPYGMPPFAHELNDAELAAVISHVRSAWGNDAPAVSALDVLRAR
jgi:mono/diheme cytochrome c family protein